MKKSTKKTSTARKLMPAFAMLAVSAMSLSSVTYAWFTMSDTVSVSGMNMKATADGGIVIINETDTDTNPNWKTSATASYSGASTAFYPTSTANGSNWYYNVSEEYDNAEASQAPTAYDKITPTDAGTLNGVYELTSAGTKAPVGNYYLLNKFYIKSSGQEITGRALKVTAVKASVDGNSASENLNKALRVLVKIGNSTFVYAPLAESAASYYVGGFVSNSESNVSVTPVIPAATTFAVDSTSNIATIPANSTAKTSAVEADVYVYFEGEDTNCKSSNITATLDTLKVEVSFGLAAAQSNDSQQGNSGDESGSGS